MTAFCTMTFMFCLLVTPSLSTVFLGDRVNSSHGF